MALRWSVAPGNSEVGRLGGPSDDGLCGNVRVVGLGDESWVESCGVIVSLAGRGSCAGSTILGSVAPSVPAGVRGGELISGPRGPKRGDGMLVELWVCCRLGSREDSSLDGTLKMVISVCLFTKKLPGALVWFRERRAIFIPEEQGGLRTSGRCEKRKEKGKKERIPIKQNSIACRFKEDQHTLEAGKEYASKW